MLSSRRLRKVFSLLMTLVILMACNLPGLADEKEGGGSTPQSDPSTLSADQILYEYGGDGTYVAVSVLAGTESTCTLPVSVSALIYQNGAVSIKSIGSCINDFHGCTVDETDRCAVYGDGTASGFSMAIGGDLDMTGCNSGSYKVSHNDVKFDSDRMVGSFQCDMGGGDSMTVNMDIPRIKK
jgi:hypothetical protein